MTSLSDGSTYAYDANGNMIARSEGGVLYQQEFDIENRLRVVTHTTTSAVTGFVYDGDGVRAKRTASGGTTVYVGQYYEVQGSTIRKYYYLGGRRIALKEGSEVYYLHADHLGSTSLTTNSSGGKVAEQRYLPYGETRWVTGTVPTDFTFTGQRSDTYTQFIEMGVRWYSPRLGRFVSADSIVPGAGSASLNRFMYGRGNPLSYRDPSGHAPIYFDHRGYGGGVVGMEPVIPVVPHPAPPSPVATRTPVPDRGSAPSVTSLRTQMPSVPPVRTPGPVGTPTAEEMYPSAVPVLTALGIDTVGLRVETSFQIFSGGWDVNLDLMANLQSGELDLIVGTGPQVGLGAASGPTAGIVVGFGAPTNDSLLGGDLYYSGGGVPIASLLISLEGEFAGSPTEPGTGTLYLGVGPLGAQTGFQWGVSSSFSLFRLDLW